jgi:hypothetical protein
VKDHLPLSERPAACDGEQPPHVLGGHAGEEGPLHCGSVCHERDIRNVVRANDARRDSS